MPAPSVAASARLAVSGTLALALLELLWEIVLAPLTPHGYWLAVKALPLALLLPGVARGARKPRQWLALLLPFYAAEGLVRAVRRTGPACRRRRGRLPDRGSRLHRAARLVPRRTQGPCSGAGG